MQLQIMSDLHLEFYGKNAIDKIDSFPVAAETLVLAGDITTLDASRLPPPFLVFERFLKHWKRVVYVPGNHEFYGTPVNDGLLMLNELSDAFPNLHILQGDWTELDGVRFVGGTMWFPPNDAARKYQRYMNDFELIEDFVPWVYDTHEDHVDTIRRKAKGSVVVTHHLPHPRSVHKAYETSPLNPFFMSPDAAPLAEGAGAKLWIHGHTHNHCDYVLPGGTRVVCNPHGYPGESVPGVPFKPGFVVEVE